ncbi:MAG TPA: M6 family metalloprotease domain-containing protein [Longimicrobiales bacterium]
MSEHFCRHDALCMIPPHPKLRDQLKAELDQLNETSQLAGPLKRVIEPGRPGMNDGLIIPGDQFEPGTPLQRVRREAAVRAPLRGTVRVVVVLAEFEDLKIKAAHSKKHFEDIFFAAKNSVKQYFAEVSRGLIDIQGEIVGPLMMPRKLKTYAHSESGMSNAQPNARTLARDAAEAANGVVNFAPYDNDGNGFVDAFIVVHAGRGAEETGSKNDIWSHKWVLPSGPYQADGTKVYAYLTVPEDAKIGVCCHELGHLLFGWPDLYDTDGSSEGLGDWCLMAGGSWNGNGDVPAHPSAWCKAEQGWVNVVTQKNNEKVTIPDVKDSRTVFRLWKEGSSGREYFLVENRQRALYDKYLPGEGLLIYHVDDSVDSNDDERHPKIALLQADGQEDLHRGRNRGDAGDPFPGTSNNHEFTRTSTPNSRSYGGVDTAVAITEISKSAATMTCKLAVRKAAVAGKQKPPVIGDILQWLRLGYAPPQYMQSGQLNALQQLMTRYEPRGATADPGWAGLVEDRLAGIEAQLGLLRDLIIEMQPAGAEETEAEA